MTDLNARNTYALREQLLQASKDGYAVSILTWDDKTVTGVPQFDGGVFFQVKPPKGRRVKMDIMTVLEVERA